MKNYSRQREIVLNVLRSTKTHPTANWIYEKSREQLPKISLGTVYRNLTDLLAAGEIIEVDVGDNLRHFDADVSDHIHFHCTECGAITDSKMPDNNIKNYVEDNIGCRVVNTKFVFSGVCKACIPNK